MSRRLVASRDIGGRGVLVAQNTIAVRANAYDAQSKIVPRGRNVINVTHIIGNFPVPPEQNIIAGTRGFHEAKDRLRVSGGNNIDGLFVPGPSGPAIAFDYLFVIGLE